MFIYVKLLPVFSLSIFQKEKKMSALLNEFQAAERLSISVTTLRTWRCTRRVNLRFSKIGRAVRYRPEDIEAFIEKRSMGGGEG